MDRETLISLSIFLFVVICLISLAFPREDRKKVFLVAVGFVMVPVSLVAVLWVLKSIFPDENSKTVQILGFISYCLILGFFGKRMAGLADKPKEKKGSSEK